MAKSLIEKARATRAKLPVKDPHVAAFDAAAKKIEKLIASVAAGDQDADEKLRPALDRLDGRANHGEIRSRDDANDFRERSWVLRQARVAAVDAGYVARREARDIEARRLRQEERASGPLPGSYEHELRMMRGGR